MRSSPPAKTTYGRHHNMNIKNTLRLGRIVWLFGGLALSAFIIEVSPWLIFPVAILMLVSLIVFSRGLKCPNCGRPVLFNRINIFGRETWFWTYRMPEICAKCGYDLARDDRRKGRPQ